MSMCMHKSSLRWAMTYRLAKAKENHSATAAVATLIKYVCPVLPHLMQTQSRPFRPWSLGCAGGGPKGGPTDSGEPLPQHLDAEYMDAVVAKWLAYACAPREPFCDPPYESDGDELFYDSDSYDSD
jgi:hypothetical protein